jgi:glycine oxidase
MHDMNERATDVLVVGAGAIGLSVAYYCAREGLSVAVIERGAVGREASWAGAGIVPAARATAGQSSYSKLLGLSSEMYPGLSAELREETGIDNGYVRCGGIEIGYDDRDLHALRSAAGHYSKEGIVWEPLTPSEARRVEPALEGDFQIAYHIPEMAQVRNPRHLKALAAACARRQARIHTGVPACGFDLDGDTVKGVCTLDGTLTAATTVVTAGAWSGHLMQSLGVQLPVRPVRGQIALLSTDTPLLRRVIMMGKEYLVPRPDGRVLVGSTEEDVGFDCRPTSAGIAGLLATAQQICPALGGATLERSWAGLRPSSPDSKPFLGPVPGYRGILVAAGHYRAGLQLSPITGLVIAQSIAGRPSSIALDAFRVDRPAASASPTAHVLAP